MDMILGEEFYMKRATESAPELIGKILCKRENDGMIIRARITETECYFGEDDTACHAHRGKTDRTKILYNRGGCAYVYLCYGIHSLLNVVTGDEGFPEAVLIRAVEGYIGPGRVTKYFGIDRTYNSENLISGGRLWIEDDGYRPSYHSAPRVGIDYADEYYRNIPWRYISDDMT